MNLVPVDGDPFKDQERLKRYRKLVPAKGNPFVEFQNEDPGSMAAIGLGFGRMADKLVQGGKQAALTVADAAGSSGARAELARMAEEQRFRDEGYAPLQEQQALPAMLGEAAPLMALPMGGSVKAAAAIGAVPGLLEYGTPEQKMTRAAAGGVGSGIGHLAGKTLGAVVSPGMKPANAEVERLATVAAKEGIPLDAAQVTGNPVMQNVKAALAKVPWTSTSQAQQAQRQQEAYTSAILRKMGQEGAVASPDKMADAHAAIGAKFDGATNGVSIRLDDPVVAGLAKVERDFLRRLPTDQKAVIRSYMDDLTGLLGQEIPGDVYNLTRSNLGRLAFETDNTTVKQSAKAMQRVLDEAFDRQAPAEAVKLMKAARKEYGIYEDTATALKRGRSQDGQPSPKQMYAAVQAATPGFERGAGGDMADLVRAGRQFLPDTIPNSGTPQQAAMMNLITAGSMGGLGALGGHLSTGDPSAGAAMGLMGFGLSKGIQGLMNSPQFSRYLMTKALEEEQKRLLAQMGGSMGLVGAAANY